MGGEGDGKSGCDSCLLFCDVFSTMPSVGMLYESVGMAQNS